MLRHLNGYATSRIYIATTARQSSVHFPQHTPDHRSSLIFGLLHSAETMEYVGHS